MPVTVSLSEVLDVLICQTETSCAFVNRETGEILACTEEGIRTAEANQDEAAPQWMQEQLPKIREALQGDPWLELPSSRTSYLDEPRKECGGSITARRTR